MGVYSQSMVISGEADKESRVTMLESVDAIMLSILSAKPLSFEYILLNHASSIQLRDWLVAHFPLTEE